MLCDIVIPKAGGRVYTYRCDKEIKKGHIVEIPFSKGSARGVIINIYEEKDLPFEIKKIKGIILEDLALSGVRLELFEHIVKYYAASEAETISLFFPPGVIERSRTECRANKLVPKLQISDKGTKIYDYLRERYPRWLKKTTIDRIFGSSGRILRKLREKGVIECRDTIKSTKPRPFKTLHQNFSKSNILKLTEEQQRIYSSVLEKIKHQEYGTFLLFGVTGSGKTAVYYKLFEHILKQGRTGLFLVPEIALTVQSVSYFLEKYGNRVFVYHSNLNNSEKNWIYQKVATSKSIVVIGPRSSLFLPFNNLSLIVIDEEHDFSYKEEERMPRYNAKELAKFLAKKLSLPLLLGSGTPDVVSFYKAKHNIYSFHTLSERFSDYTKPEIEIIDMKKEQSGSIFSIKLLSEIEYSIKRKKGVILFINRRGYNPVVQCSECGKILHCPLCSVPLVLHRREQKLKCHLCGYTTSIPDTCPYCGSTKLVFTGFGTERIEDEIKKFFKDANIAILDRDTIYRKGMKEKIYTDFINGKMDILIGTQMLSVGLDFPHVETVGVLNADMGLGFPDYRIEEKVAQTLFQVAGRLRKKGRVIVQTRMPDHPIFMHLKEHDFEAFLTHELENRKIYGYPPFVRIISITTRSKEEHVAKEHCYLLKEEIEDRFDNISILGPAQPLYNKIRGEYRWQMFLKVKEDNQFEDILFFLKKLREQKKHMKKIRIYVDPDPYSLL